MIQIGGTLRVVGGAMTDDYPARIDAILWTGPVPCAADVNGDGVVDVLDLLIVLAAWGATSGPEDINGDGIVNVLDLLEVLAAWGPC